MSETAIQHAKQAHEVRAWIVCTGVAGFNDSTDGRSGSRR